MAWIDEGMERRTPMSAAMGSVFSFIIERVHVGGSISRMVVSLDSSVMRLTVFSPEGS